MKPQVAVILIFAALLALQPFARAQSPLLIDDFSTGAASRSLTTGTDSTAHQTGAMLGRDRWIVLYASGGPFDAPSSFRARPSAGTEPSALILDTGYRANARVDLVYGWPLRMDKDLTSYEHFLVHFEGLTNGIDGEGAASCSCSTTTQE